MVLRKSRTSCMRFVRHVRYSSAKLLCTGGQCLPPCRKPQQHYTWPSIANALGEVTLQRWIPSSVPEHLLQGCLPRQFWPLCCRLLGLHPPVVHGLRTSARIHSRSWPGLVHQKNDRCAFRQVANSFVEGAAEGRLPRFRGGYHHELQSTAVSSRLIKTVCIDHEGKHVCSRNVPELLEELNNRQTLAVRIELLPKALGRPNRK